MWFVDIMTNEAIDETDVISRDDYDLALEDGVEDESLLEEPGIKTFSITSYGADYTVDSLVKRMRGGAFKVPDFQRRFVWTQKHASRFIESLLMGLPIPSIFLYKESDTNESLVIDGQQRLRTLQAYYDGVFAEKKFKLLGVREPWNNKSYKELSSSDQLKIDDSIVHAIIFRQDSPQDVLDSIYYVFERINSGGIRLSPQEIRNCISAGKFIGLVKRLNEHLSWREIFGPINKRSKDEELIVRFFAMLRDSDTYSKPMAKFLNDKSADYNKLSDSTLQALGKLFRLSCDLTWQALGRRAFRPSRALNAAMFDAFMPAVALAVKSGKPDVAARIQAGHEALLADPAFIKACESGTSSEESVLTRTRIARQVMDVG